MKWKTYLMGAAANERMERMGQSAHLSHACEILPGGALRPLCSVKLTSLCLDDSLTAEGELPDCPTCKPVSNPPQSHLRLWQHSSLAFAVARRVTICNTQ
jgi:hypothetical protein